MVSLEIYHGSAPLNRVARVVYDTCRAVHAPSSQNETVRTMKMMVRMLAGYSVIVHGIVFTLPEVICAAHVASFPNFLIATQVTPTSCPAQMFANHLVTIAPHAAVMLSPSNRSSKSRNSSTSTRSPSQEAKKSRTKSEDASTSSKKNEAGANISMSRSS